VGLGLGMWGTASPTFHCERYALSMFCILWFSFGAKHPTLLLGIIPLPFLVGMWSPYFLWDSNYGLENLGLWARFSKNLRTNLGKT